QVDVARVDASVGDAAVDRFEAQVARGLIVAGVAALVDAGPLDDPVRIEPEPLEQLLAVNDDVRDVAAGANDAESHEAPATRAGRAGPVGVVGAGRHREQSPEWRARGELKKEV